MAAVGAALVLLARAPVGSSGIPASSSRAAAVRAASLGAVPLVRQAYHNNCETAALSMLLAAAGVEVDQRKLQAELPLSGPLDPVVAADGSWTWGDPDQGFVGRVRGGGVAGGFGVYQGPIRRLAERYGVQLYDLSRHPATEIFDRLERGSLVLAWIGLSEGPYKRWRTPGGKSIGVNFGEHTVVLTGVRGDVVSVNDPLTGTRSIWTRAGFLLKWKLLGQRALAL